MATKFRRSYRLDVDFANAQELGPPIPGTAKSITIKPPFSVAFDVDRANYADVSCAQFTIYGLGKTARTQLYKDYYDTDIRRRRFIEFWAGYQSQAYTEKMLAVQPRASQQTKAAENAQLFSMLFRGSMIRCYSEKSGPGWTTVIEATVTPDSVQSFTGRSYAAGTPIQQIIMEIISDMPNVRVGAVGSFPGVLARGNTFAGSPMDCLAELTGGRCFIDNCRIYCLQDNEFLPATVPVISKRSGLVGAPRREKTFITATTLFEPGLIIGQSVKLETETVPEYNGTYQVVGLRHRGMISEAVSAPVTTTVSLTNNPLLTHEVPVR